MADLDQVKTPISSLADFFNVSPFVDRSVSSILEPCCGTGTITNYCWYKFNCHRVITCDIDPKFTTKYSSSHIQGDFTNNRIRSELLGLNNGKRFDLIIGHPPKNVRLTFVKESLAMARNVCFFLPLHFLASKKRSAFFQISTPDVFVMSRRPEFKEKDINYDYAWFMWPPRFDWPTIRVCGLVSETSIEIIEKRMKKINYYRTKVVGKFV